MIMDDTSLDDREILDRTYYTINLGPYEYGVSQQTLDSLSQILVSGISALILGIGSIYFWSYIRQFWLLNFQQSKNISEDKYSYYQIRAPDLRNIKKAIERFRQHEVLKAAKFRKYLQHANLLKVPNQQRLKHKPISQYRDPTSYSRQRDPSRYTQQRDPTNYTQQSNPSSYTQQSRKHNDPSIYCSSAQPKPNNFFETDYPQKQNPILKNYLEAPNVNNHISYLDNEAKDDSSQRSANAKPNNSVHDFGGNHVQISNKASKTYTQQDFDRKYDQTSKNTSPIKEKQSFIGKYKSKNAAPNYELHGFGGKYKPLRLSVVNGKDIRYGGWIPKSRDGYYADSGFESGFRNEHEDYEQFQPQRVSSAIIERIQIPTYPNWYPNQDYSYNSWLKYIYNKNEDTLPKQIGANIQGAHNTVFSIPNQLVASDSHKVDQNGAHETSTEKLTIVTPKYVIHEVDLNSIHEFTHQGFQFNNI